MTRPICKDTTNELLVNVVELRQQLDHVQKQLVTKCNQLEIAIDALKDIDKTRSVANHKIGTQDKTLNPGNVFCWTTPDEIHNTLEQITILEQKDK